MTDDEIHIIIRKQVAHNRPCNSHVIPSQLSHASSKYKQIGVSGAVAVLSSVCRAFALKLYPRWTAESRAGLRQPFASWRPSRSRLQPGCDGPPAARPQRVRSSNGRYFSRFLRRTASDPSAAALFFDELASISDVLHDFPQVEAWISLSARLSRPRLTPCR